jgi:hypothetical protein
METGVEIHRSTFWIRVPKRTDCDSAIQNSVSLKTVIRINAFSKAVSADCTYLPFTGTFRHVVIRLRNTWTPNMRIIQEIHGVSPHLTTGRWSNIERNKLCKTSSNKLAPLVTILSQFHPHSILTAYFCKIHHNVIILSSFALQNSFSPEVFRTKFCMLSLWLWNCRDKIIHGEWLLALGPHVLSCPRLLLQHLPTSGGHLLQPHPDVIPWRGDKASN